MHSAGRMASDPQPWSEKTHAETADNMPSEHSVAEDSAQSVGSKNVSDDDRPADELEQQQQKPESEQKQQASSSPPPPPDGGYGWVCTVCSALINGHTWGLNSSYGVFLAYYLSHNTFPGATQLDYAFVGGLSIAVAMFISPLATIMTRQFGTHATLFTGVILETASLIGASFASKIWQLFLSQGVCFGLGMGFLFIGSVPIPSQWFSTKRSLANGIATSGSGIFGLVYSLATGAMLQTIGLAWAFRVLGILCFVVNCTCSALLRDRNKIIGVSQKPFDTQILRRPEYLLIGGWGFFSLLGYVVLIFSLANYANSIGLSQSKASLVAALFNLGQGFGRPPIGYFSDNVGRINMAAGMTFLAGLFALVVWDFADSFGVLVFYALLGGSVAGTFWCTISPVTVEVVGLRHNASGMNLMWLIITLPSAFSEAIALEIAQHTGSYRGTILFTGFMYIAASLCLVLLRGWKLGEREFLASLREQRAGEEKEDSAVRSEDEQNAEAQKAGRKTMWKYCFRLTKV